MNILKTNTLLFFVALFSLQSCGQNNTIDTEKIKNVSSDVLLKSDTDWKNELTDEQYYILREKGTERPYSGKLLLNKEKGIYKCAACGNELFTDEMKFDSHCGWPSFDKEIAGGKIIQKVDNSLGMKRTEIACAKCGGHLGHIFDDGPTETGKRYCVNSVSLSFTPAENTNTNVPNASNFNATDTVVLGGGCFWCTEAIYEELSGVISVESGYSGGKTKDPSYEEVSSGNTGHAEVTRIIYNTKETSLDEILKVFFIGHDPTTLNSQGADYGTQYRSVIFYKNENQKNIAQSLINTLNKEVYDGKIVTQLKPFETFYIAEKYHQDYYTNNKDKPYCRMVIQPKIEKFEKAFKDRLKKQ
ncbi:MAG: bifunctional methionine sulfoxide reductase B/A protein [Chitinophagaceae bacterium]